MAEPARIVDLSHHNGPADSPALKASGVAGVILKASQGVASADPLFRRNLSGARAAGLLCGAYHFGVAGDGAAQAAHFLAMITSAAAVSGADLSRVSRETSLRLPLLHVLDFEDYPPHSMRVSEAEAFVEFIEKATGKAPGLYSGNTLREALRGRQSPILSRCWLWVPRYSSLPPIVPSGWNRWDLWQYTDKGSEKGAGQCDESRFNGTPEQLAAFWAERAA